MIDEADSCRESNAFDVSCQHCGRYIIASRLIAELANQLRWPIARETMAAAVQWASLEKGRWSYCARCLMFLGWSGASRCRSNRARDSDLQNLEPLFVLGSAAMGVVALVPAYREKHGRKSCLALFASGLLCLLLRRKIGLPSVAIEPVVTAVGASLIINAHVLNLRFSKRCRCCDPLSESRRLPEIPAVAIPERKT